MKKNYFYIGILLIILSSCSGYEKLLKSSDYSLKYRKAFEYYNTEDYTRAAGLFEQVVPVFRGTSKADSASYFQAMTAYKQEDYLTAQYFFSTFVQTFANSQFAEEAEYLAAYCLYLESPRPSLDQENTIKSIEGFEIFARKYPLSKHLGDCKTLISEMQDKLVEKSYLSAKLYYDMEMYKASIVALKSSLEEFPNTKYREELMWFILDSNFKLAENSVASKVKERYLATIDEYYSFIAEFPKSKRRDDAEKIYQKAQKVTK